MAASISSKDSSERLWPSPYSPTATLSTAKSVPQPTFVQTRNSIQSRPQEVRTQSPKPGASTTKSPEMKKMQVESQQANEKSVNLWPSPYSKEMHEEESRQSEQGWEQGEVGKGNESRARVEETSEPGTVKKVEVPESKKPRWRDLLCFGCFR
ncbi:hypothetical protein DL98DRAFT_655328 [Cadophora sp. DSE1049]|nr:hypothetical protein DL98DRAFT_655328 [Cadophora sp. DSE1049]